MWLVASKWLYTRPAIHTSLMVPKCLGSEVSRHHPNAILWAPKSLYYIYKYIRVTARTTDLNECRLTASKSREMTGMTNYPIGPHQTQLDPTRPQYVILPVHITLKPMQTGRPIKTGQLRHKKTYVPKLVSYILPSSAAALTAVSVKLY